MGEGAAARSTGLLGWPDVRSMRCLDLGEPAWHFADALAVRGAAEVVVRHGALPAELDPDVLGEFDLVAAGDVLRPDDPGTDALLDGIARVCAGVLVSVEPIDAVTSVLGRGRAVVTAAGTMNGWAHRELLARIGRRVESVSRPFVVPGPPVPGAGGVVDRAVTALLARTSRPGVLHRGLVVRVRLPGGDPLRRP